MCECRRAMRELAFRGYAKGLLVFAELPVEQRLDGLERVLGVRAFSPDH